MPIFVGRFLPRPSERLEFPLLSALAPELGDSRAQSFYTALAKEAQILARVCLLEMVKGHSAEMAPIGGVNQVVEANEIVDPSSILPRRPFDLAPNER